MKATPGAVRAVGVLLFAGGFCAGLFFELLSLGPMLVVMALGAVLIVVAAAAGRKGALK